MIPIAECVDRGVYKIESRNLSVGVFCTETCSFIGIRTKWHARFLDSEEHWDKGLPHGTAKPIEKIGVLPINIVNAELIEHEHGCLWWDGRPVVRHNVQAGEEKHGQRDGFVDCYADTGERLPNDVYPNVRHNQALFVYLDLVMKEEIG